MIRLGEKFYNHVANYRNYIRRMESKRSFELDQVDLLQEECAELIQALSKLKRGKKCAKLGVIEEITHVLISIDVVSDILGIGGEQIENCIEEKEKALKDYYGE